MAHCSTPEPYLSRALALQEPPQTVPLVLLPFPQPQTPERRTELRRHLLTVELIAPVLLRSTQPHFQLCLALTHLFGRFSSTIGHWSTILAIADRRQTAVLR